ncbi:hypothetical protein [Mesorhizobium sp.]|uniref:hypothetical protein n=1 Tax=Mesorhizobium sp. TaxID=1871066 RepID=UPI0011FA7CBA|nr:hypothetical protein [Mesorhizobium sp.]TIO05743.1 MAG: hypothetical protein E5X88_26020 [Mesorhizobium sp.]TIO33138.1 MAG: hypothetical protein E5X89_17340 [Mesorhizobium sp.]TIP08258.1 MAG: hypothetical protein E5X73_32805 [Mesorhizobium sp.]
MTVTTRFLVELRTAAEAAKVAESHFRRDAAVRTAALEQERAFAFRRLNLMQAIAEAMASAESEEIAVASAFATLRTRLGWNSDSEARSEVIARFGQVVLAIFRAPDEEESANAIPEALAGFERWYAETRGSPFWLLFEHQIPDTPRVDF